MTELTDEIMQELADSQDRRKFVRDVGETEIEGSVRGRGTAYVATGTDKVEQVWMIEDDEGHLHGIAISEWSMRDE